MMFGPFVLEVFWTAYCGSNRVGAAHIDRLNRLSLRNRVSGRPRFERTPRLGFHGYSRAPADAILI